MDLLSALRVLRSATTETLESHHQEVWETLEDLRKRLRTQFSPDNQSRRESSVDSAFSVNTEHGSNNLCHASGLESQSRADSSKSFTSNDHNDGATECDTSTGYASEIESAPDSTSHQPSQWTIKLLATLNDDVRWLYDYSQETTKHTIRNKRRNTSDERIKDILRVEGARGHPSNEDKIFRDLAQRSMGIQFTEIQREKAQRKSIQPENRKAKLQTRVDELVESICASDPELRKRIHKRSNLLSKDLDQFNYHPDDKKILSQGIRAGFKRLVVEELFAQRLKESGRPAEPSGISAFTALGVTAFDRLLYEDIPGFLDELFSREVEFPLESAKDCRRTGAVQLPDALAALSRWFDELQTNYDIDNRTRAGPSDSAAFHGEQRAQKRPCTSWTDAAILYQRFETLPSRYNSTEIGGYPTPSNSGSSTQLAQQIADAPVEATDTVSEVSAMSDAPLSTNQPPSLGNWDRDYDALPAQTVQGSPTRFLWGNCGRMHRDVTFSSMNEHQSLKNSALWGNWDQDYGMASLGTEQTTSSNFPWGNWDQNYEIASSELQEQQPLPQRNWDQNYVAASPRVDRAASSTFGDANWDANEPGVRILGSSAYMDQSRGQPWGNWDRDYGAPSGASWTTSDPFAMLQV